MARKDANAQQTPVDQYRKSLGKHQNHEQKKEQRVTRQKQRKQLEKSSSGGYGTYILVSLLFILVAIYGLIYFGLKYEDKYVQMAVDRVNAWWMQNAWPYLKDHVAWLYPPQEAEPEERI